MNFGAKQAELMQLMHKVVAEFFTTNAPDPTHWTPNLYFGAFRTISLLQELWYKTGQTGTINA
jgi:hypothetical protein